MPPDGRADRSSAFRSDESSQPSAAGVEGAAEDDRAREALAEIEHRIAQLDAIAWNLPSRTLDPYPPGSA